MNFNKPLTLAIADDHILFRSGIRNLIKEMNIFDCIYEAGNGQELLSLCNENKIDLILLDSSMPVMDGLEAARLLKQKWPRIRIIVLTMYDDAALVRAYLDIGVDGYLLKNSDPEELNEAIQNVLLNQTYISNLVSSAAASRIPFISLKEKEIIKLLSQGKSSTEIATALELTNNTVESYRIKLLKKYQVKNTAQLISFCFKTGQI
jgi:two-component system, NarL family, response regulator DegU